MPSGDASIRRTAELTGVGAATLRAWEARYGFPRPLRLPGGHRRYSAEEIDLIRRVREEHADGLSVPAAVERVLASASRPASIFAAIRDALPATAPQRLPKAALIAVSHALEDECAWRAESAILVGGFQHRRFYDVERDRWAEFAATAAGVFVVAEDLATDHPARRAEPAPITISLEPGDLARREWFVLCRSAAFCAVLVGWERPRRRRERRRFEVVWTLEPEAASAALDTVANLAERRAPGAARRLDDLRRGMPLPPPPDNPTTMAVCRRVVEYLAGQL